MSQGGHPFQARFELTTCNTLFLPSSFTIAPYVPAHMYQPFKCAFFPPHVETLGLVDVQPVEMLQDQAQCILSDYVRHKHPRQATRFGRFLLLLPCIRSIAASTVEKLFFRDTIGDIPIEKLLADMYNMEKFE